MIFSRKQNSELERFADLLIKGTRELFAERGEGLSFTEEPKKERRQIMEWNGKMRADGMDKFDNESTYVSAVNFYANQADMSKNKTLGALVVYIQQEYLPKLMRTLKYPPIDDESEQAMLDSCGTLCNIIGGRFKSEISKNGYIELEWSHFYNYRNSAFDGVHFCFAEYTLYEVAFKIENAKRMVIEMTMGVVPKRA